MECSDVGGRLAWNEAKRRNFASLVSNTGVIDASTIELWLLKVQYKCII